MKVLRKSSLGSVNAVYFAWGLAAYFALVLNSGFIFHSYQFVMKDGLTIFNLFLFLSIPFFLLFVFISLFSLLAVKYVEKLIFIVLTLVSSVLSYANFYYGLLFDDYSPVMGAIEQTTLQELRPFITPSFLGWFLLFGVVPSYVIYKIKLIHPALGRDIGMKLLGFCCYPLFYVVILWPSLPIYHPMVRLSGLAGRLPYQIIPTNFAESAFNYYRDKLVSYFPYPEIGLDAVAEHQNRNGKNNLLVLVVGETARSMNFGLNGYQRETNKYTMNQNVISFRDVSACGTATRISVPCMFSSLTRREFFSSIADHQDSLLDILKRADFNLLWIDNNGGGTCQGVCKHIELIEKDTMDGVLVDELAQQIEKRRGKDSVVVLHLQGSHGPNYHTKYPTDFAQFKPACEKDELRFCNPQTLVNAYDNSLLYTDFVLSEMIKVLQGQSEFWNAALIYTSDHGESIGEYGLYGHCAPYFLAPAEQTQVPLVIWASEAFTNEKNLSLACLKNKAVNEKLSHDHLFHSVLGLMDVRTTVYQSQLDLFQSCRT